MSIEEKLSLDKVMANLNKEIDKIKGYSLKGLINAAIDIRYDMEHTPPLIPVETGNLRSSFFIVTSKGEAKEGSQANFKGKKAGELQAQHSAVMSDNSSKINGKENPTITLGFSANYSMIVHERYGVHFQRPGSGAGFLVAAINRNKEKIIKDIKESVKV